MAVDGALSDLLNHAPELQQTPGLTLGVAQGLTTLGAPVDTGQVAQATSLGLMAQGAQQAVKEQQAVLPKFKNFNDLGAAVKSGQFSHDQIQSATKDLMNRMLDGGSSGWFDSPGAFLGHVGGAVNNDFLHPIERDVVHPVGQVLNGGLQEVTHVYRYIHDVWQKHGALAAIGEIALAVGAGVLTGGAADVGLLAGIAAGTATADLAARSHLGNVAGVGFQDSWNATSNGMGYRDRQGWHVSPGRDLDRLLGYVTGQQVHETDGGQHVAGFFGSNVISGATDAAFDMSLDPTMQIGKLTQAAKLARRVPQLAESWRDIEGGAQLARRPLVDEANVRPNNVQVIFQNNPGVRDAFNRIATMDTKGVLGQYPMLRPMAKALGQAHTGQEVADTFEMALTARNYSFSKYGLPSTTLTRRLLGKVGVDTKTAAGYSEAAQSKFSRVAVDSKGNPIVNHDTGLPVRVPSGPIGHTINAFTSYAPFAFNSKTLELSGKHGDPTDPEFLRGLYSVLRYSQNAATANSIVARYVEAPDLAEKISILTNGYRDALRASGLPDESTFAGKVLGGLDFHVKQALGAVYAVGRDGRPIRLMDDEGNIINRGVFVNQTGKIAFPDFNEWRKAIAENKGGIWAKTAHADEFLNRYITTRFFKRLVLLSAGFALRVSAGELIPAALSMDARRVIGGGLAAASAKLNPDITMLAREGADATGIRVATPGIRHVGTVDSIDHEAGQATVNFGDEQHIVPISKLTFFHTDVTDEETVKALREYGASFTREDLPHIRAAVGKALYGVSRGLVDPTYREVALLNVIANNGHMVADGLASSHDLPRGFEGINESTRRAAIHAGANIKKNQALGKAFRLWESGDENHPLFWKFALGEAANDGGIRAMAQAHHAALAEGEDAATRAGIAADRTWFESSDPTAVKARTDMAHYNMDPEQYSAIRMEALKGLTYGQNGKANPELLQTLARGETPSISDLAAKPLQDRPQAVKGRTLESIAETGTLDRVIAKAWHPIHGIINGLSRTPIYTTMVTDEYKFFRPWIESGQMTKAEAHSIAQVRTLNRMLPLIHNTMLRNKFSLVARNIVPFYFAQEQAYKRYGRVMFSNPTAFRKMMLLSHSLHTTGALQQDGQGNTYIAFPGVGDVSKMMTLGMNNLGINVLGGVPTSVSGNTISLRTVVPEAVGPGVGPVVAIPLKELAKQFHPADPFVKGLLGTFGGGVAANASIKQELIPNATVRRVWEALDTSEQNRVFSSTMSMNIAWATHKATPLWAEAEKIDPRAMDMSTPREQLLPGAQSLLAKADKFIPLPNADTASRQVAMDRLKNTTRVQLMFKAIFGFLSPLAPQQEEGDVQLHHELNALIQKHGIIEGLHTFTDKHPDATPDTVFQSNNKDTNTNPPATGKALSWIDQNRGWVQSNSLAAAYLIPQGPGGFDSSAYNEELSLHLRQRRTPSEFLDAVYTAIGNAEFIPSLKAYQAQRDAAQQSGDTATAAKLGSEWQGYFTDLQHRNPVWYENEFSATKDSTAIKAYDQLVSAVSSKHTPDSPMLPVVRQLIDDFHSYQQQLALAQSGTGTRSQTEIKAGWKDYMDSYAAAHPEAQSLVYGVFRRLGGS